MVCVRHHLATVGRGEVADTADITLYNLPGVAISRVFDVTEPSSPKPGDGRLKLLETGSNLIGEAGIVPEGGGAGVGGSASAAEKYLDTFSTLRSPPPPSRTTVV